MTTAQKVSVIGAGSIGSMFGGLIQYHNPDIEVVLAARGEHCQAMQASGCVELRGDWGSRKVKIRATSDPADVAGSDVVLFTVKTQDTVQTAKQFADEIGDAVVVSLQNGINQHLLSNVVDHTRLLVGMTSTNMSIDQPGIVTCNRSGLSVIGGASDQVLPNTIEVAHRTLALSQLPIEVSDQILGTQYNKLLLNTMGYASVLSETELLREGILDSAWRNQVAIPILAEGLRVLDAAKIPIQRVSGMSDIFRFRRMLNAFNLPGLGHLATNLLGGPFKLPSVVFSVYQDLMRRRPTEIDYVNGEIVRLGKEHGVNTPLNSEVVRLVHEMEQAPETTFYSRQQVVDRFREMRQG